MTTRQYSSRSQQTTLTGAITSGATSMTVVSGTALLGGVTIPAGRTFTLVIDVDTALEEIVDATAVSTNTFTITRAIDGSTAQEHSAGAVVRHMAIGRDYRDANLHTQAAASYNDGSGNAQSLHGIASGEGDVVGTLKTQTLTNKTLTSPTISNPTITGTSGVETSIVFEGATADAHETTLTVVDPTQDNTITLPNTTGTVVIADATQTLTNKTMGDALNAGGFKITNLATPTDASDAVRKDFADAQVAAAATSAASAATSATSAATSAASASTSASSALTSANSASTSAASALTSANSAATSASTMAASVAAAATSAASAATSATAAATSASSASTSASSALTSANSASTSASAASTSATSAAASATAASTSASSASTSASSALTSANSASASATAAATSASSASTSASAAATSATSAAASATAAATSATAAAASAASVDATATIAAELRQYGAEGSILNNIPTRVHPAENLLRQAVYWIDSNHTSSSNQTVDNLGWTGSLLPTTLGSSTAADSNDPKFLDWTGTNYVYTTGVAGNYLSTPDAAALDITGDIDIRVKVAMDDWTPGATSMLLAKEQTTSSRSYKLQVGTAGNLLLLWSEDGTTLLSATSTVVTGLADGSTKWVRGTLDVDNGASGRDINFYTSDDGTTWTQLGTTVTQAGTTSIYSSTSQVEVGTRFAGTLDGLAGKLFRAQIFNGIDGTKVLDVDTSIITSGAATSFFALSGQTVTINRSTSGRKTVAVTHPCWLFGTDDYMEVNNRYMASGTYLYLPGVASNYASTPDAAALDITGDIDIRVKVAMDDWTPSALSALVTKWHTVTSTSYALYLRTDGKLALIASSNGTLAVDNTSASASTVATGLADGATKWVRATLDVDNGSGGRTYRYYLSDDGTNWTQLGTDVVIGGGTIAIFNSTAVLAVGQEFTQYPSRGKFFRAQVLDGIDGTVVFDANFETSITSLLQASFTESSANAATVTIGRSGDVFESAGITEAGYLYPGATNTFTASATDFLNFGAADSFTFLAVHRKWDTAENGAVITNRSTVTGTITPGYYIGVTTASGGINRTYAGISGRTVSLAAGLDAGTGWTNGVLNTHVATVNRSTNILSLSKNAGTAATTSISTITDSSTNFDPIRIGAPSPSGSSYAAMELVAAAVFRRALTDAEIATISNYYAGRIGA